MTESIKHLQIHKLEDMNIHRNLGAGHDPMQIGPPSITIHVAPKGSPIYNQLGEDTGNTSQWGHTYISIRGINPVTHNYEQISMGLSPGEDWGSSKDNLSFNDHVRYKSASTLTITSNNQQFFSHFNNLYTAMHDYKTGKTQPPNYNPFSLTGEKTCGKFVQSELEKAGMQGINIPFWPDDAYENLDNLADDYETPLVIDLDGNGVQTLVDSFGVEFDFKGNAIKSRTGWVHPDDGLLVWDKNKDGMINSGNELFGNNSLQISNTRLKDGFSALSELDSNTDRIINSSDKFWLELKVWQDKNSDGISQFHELTNLSNMGINAIELNANELNFYDENGNFHKLMAKVSWDNNKQTEVVDVLFHQRANTINLQQNFNQLIDNMVGFSFPSNDDCIFLIADTITSYPHTTSLFTNDLGKIS
ncbi:hypothetical protein ACPW90_001357 [Providencia rettgeri]|uniref:hypothetical protein n=1 Tax=Providencia TaxID=586 RepID=UPI0018E46928|nr:MULTISPECIES: hypothetical protein [Providencia]EJD6378329.1 hypothetical protein [Providencia rettgeri]ELR5118210.1 hypothetical protein [Providencia rettgeri]MBI6202788.1 hypothetical protein [Providencia rettgeri]MCG5280997.1 hypothetical protein [Providencia rettgeri]HBK4774446.1 hypothetical protein [Providencia rettgeri]